jgi:hypothetical protein
VNYTIYLTVLHVNLLPVATLTGPANGTTVNSARPTFAWTVLDADNGNLLSDLYVSPTKALIVGQDASAIVASGVSGGNYTLTKDLVPGTVYYWTVIPFDGTDEGTCSNGIFQFTVSTSAPINHPPTINALKDQKVTVKKELKVAVKASDPDPGAVLTFVLGPHPSGMNISKDGVITWTPTATQTGNYTVTVSVSDGEYTAVSSFTVQVVKEPKSVKSVELKFGMGAVIAIILLVLIFLVAWAMSRKEEKKTEPPVAAPVQISAKDEEE